MKDAKSALKHFESADPIMAELTRQALASSDPPLLKPPVKPELYFYELVESIVSQQLSIKAAATIWKRFVELVGEVTPPAVLAVTHEQMRAVGMSNAKAAYTRGLAEMLTAEAIDLSDLDKLDNEAVIERLVQIKGIGRWSAEMFLMFTLARPDVFSTGDLGLVRAVEIAYKKPGIKPDKLEKLAGVWSPYRTYAAMVLWHSRDNAPLMESDPNLA
jgi:DNA-3-methyladenine glycosylase II